MGKIVAIQGFKGSFHQEAAQKYFQDKIEIQSCRRFSQVVESVVRGDVDNGIIAIENSTAGSILSNYGLLQQANLHITGEVYLHIRQHLMVLPGCALEDITAVHSHPMALLQCKNYLDQHAHWQLVESDDTALSAMEIADANDRHTAAIASELAASLHKLNIIASDIHTENDNYTRFLVLNRHPQEKTAIHAPKASLYFEIDNTIGHLSTVLCCIAENGINMSKLQSFPIPDKTWQYYFHVDLECDDLQQFEEALVCLQTHTKQLRVLGIYNDGKVLNQESHKKIIPC